MSQSKAAENQASEKPKTSFTVRILRSACVAIALIALGRALGFC